MRLHHGMLLAAVALLAGIDATSMPADTERNKISKAVNLPRLLMADEHDVVTKRFLRTEEKDTGNDIVDDEERMLGIPSLSTITETVKKIPGASTITGVGKNLPGASMVGDLAQKLQYQYWLKSSKTPDDVMVILGLDKLGVKMLDSPNLGVWIRFTRIYNQQKNLPEMSKISEVLKKIPADRMAEMAKKIPGYEKFQYQYWLASSKTPDDVKVILGLDKLGVKMLDSPNLGVWIRFTSIYNQQKNLPETSMISEVLKKIPADRMVGLAKKIPGYETLQSQYWMRSSKTPDDIMGLLGLDKLGVKMLDSPNLDVWIRFTRMYNQQKNLPEASMISELLKKIPADRMVGLATKIPNYKTLLSEHWMAMKKTPDQVKSLLKLDNLGTKTLDNPNLDIWIRFQRMYKEKHGITTTA